MNVVNVKKATLNFSIAHKKQLLDNLNHFLSFINNRKLSNRGLKHILFLFQNLFIFLYKTNCSTTDFNSKHFFIFDFVHKSYL